MKLKELYKHRTDFTIIGLTGRTGSGCSQLADLLSKDFKFLTNGLRDSTMFDDSIFKRKFEISKQYLEFGNNWQSFDIIKYKNVLLLYALKKMGNKYLILKKTLLEYYKEKNQEDNSSLVDSKFEELKEVLNKHKDMLEDIYNLPSFNKIKKTDTLISLNDIFFGPDFTNFSEDFFSVLEKDNYFRRTCFLHHIACNIRSSKKSSIENATNPNNVYTIAELINILIKAKRKFNNSDLKNPQHTKIVIDSLRNSLEVTFFKERYSAFYMVAMKDIINNSRERLDRRFKVSIPDQIKRNELINKMIELDDTEYRSKDFSSGVFTSPNVEHCIQKSDYHIFNLNKEEIGKFLHYFKSNNLLTLKEENRIKNSFLTREEQLMKLISLIYQPGLITPSASERNMQIAYTAKLNSGCVSRQVGAVITDENYIAKSIGWNDVAKGHTPCNLRNVEDFFDANLNSNIHYSDFEKGNASNISEYKYKNSKISNFKEAIIDYYKEDLDAKKS